MVLLPIQKSSDNMIYSVIRSNPLVQVTFSPGYNKKIDIDYYSLSGTGLDCIFELTNTDGESILQTKALIQDDTVICNFFAKIKH